MKRHAAFILAAMAVLTGIACISRYRTDLYMITETSRDKVKVEGTEYVAGAVFGDPYAETKLVPGADNCIILRTGMRGKHLSADLTQTWFLGYDEYLQTLIYLQLPENPQPGALDLIDRSFVQILGRYEQPAEAKIFLAHAGSLVIDSIGHEKMFCTLDGDYRNKAGDSLQYRGEFKAKVAD